MPMHPPRTDRDVRSLMTSTRPCDMAERDVYQVLESGMERWVNWDAAWSVPSGPKHREVDFLLISKRHGAALVEVKQPPLVPVKTDHWEWIVPGQNGAADALYDRDEAPHRQMRACLNDVRATVKKVARSGIPPNICHFLVLHGTSSDLWRQRGPDLPQHRLKTGLGGQTDFPIFEDFIICLGDQLPHLPHLIAHVMKESFERSHPDAEYGKIEYSLWKNRKKLFQCAGLRHEHGAAPEETPELLDKPVLSAPPKSRIGMIAASLAVLILLAAGGWAWLHGNAATPVAVGTQQPQTSADQTQAPAAPDGAEQTLAIPPQPAAADQPEAEKRSEPQTQPTPAAPAAQTPVPPPGKNSGSGKRKAAARPHKAAAKPASTTAAAQTARQTATQDQARPVADTPVTDTQGRTCVDHVIQGVIDGMTVPLHQKLCQVGGAFRPVGD